MLLRAALLELTMASAALGQRLVKSMLRVECGPEATAAQGLPPLLYDGPCHSSSSFLRGRGSLNALQWGRGRAQADEGGDGGDARPGAVVAGRRCIPRAGVRRSRSRRRHQPAARLRVRVGGGSIRRTPRRALAPRLVGEKVFIGTNGCVRYRSTAGLHRGRRRAHEGEGPRFPPPRRTASLPLRPRAAGLVDARRLGGRRGLGRRRRRRHRETVSHLVLCQRCIGLRRRQGRGKGARVDRGGGGRGRHGSPHRGAAAVRHCGLPHFNATHLPQRPLHVLLLLHGLSQEGVQAR